MAKNTFRRSSWRQRGMVIDFINIILSVLILIASAEISFYVSCDISACSHHERLSGNKTL